MGDSSQLLVRFNRLMRDLENGLSARNSFQPWEVELLIDMQSCELPAANRRRLLRRYQTAAARSLECGAALPLKLSEYLNRVQARHYRRSAPQTLSRKTA